MCKSALQYYTYDSTNPILLYNSHVTYAVLYRFTASALYSVTGWLWFAQYVLYIHVLLYKITQLEVPSMLLVFNYPFAPAVYTYIHRQQQQIVYYICCGYASCARIKQENIFSFPVLCAPRESTVSVLCKGRTHKCAYVCV